MSTGRPSLNADSLLQFGTYPPISDATCVLTELFRQTLVNIRDAAQARNEPGTDFSSDAQFLLAG
jgi:hypothetical protein